MNQKLSIAIVAASLTAMFGPFDLARAQDLAAAKHNVPSVVVRWSDLDLSSTRDIRTLYGRIQAAAWSVCRDMPPRPVSIESVQCRRNLVDEAVSRINQPALTALHSRKRGSSQFHE